MESGRFQRIDALYQAARALDPGARDDFLARECADDPDMREEVASLLEAAERAGDFLATPVAGPAVPFGVEQFLDDTASELVGQHVGPYRLAEVLGSGGMGTVYLAIRDDDEYRKKVAIKLVKRGMDTGAVLSRFRSERQALANLDHLNIARLLDGGTTEDGRPYLVMEYIDGQAIDDHCDARRLSIRERLECFQAVCEAVRYAHRALTVHRDIKPGNILVTSEGVPKLLDFGIAKILGPNASNSTLTSETQRFLTPECASPEQVRGEAVTTTSDVYSLGVVLYELLTGHWPYRTTSRNPQELGRVICEQEPVKPSVAVQQTEEFPSAEGVRRVTPQSVSRTRGGSPDRLRRRLAGDLDNIVLMALRKEPDRRYASVEQLSEDVQRHLAGLPVRARTPTLRYRTGKYLRRNKVWIAAASLVLVSMIGGTVGVVREARRARAEAEVSRRLLACLDSLFWDYDPSRSGQTGMTARELLDRGSERVFAQLEDLPEGQAKLAERIALTYHGLGLKADATRWHERVVTIHQKMYGRDDLRLVDSLQALGYSLSSIEPDRAVRLLEDVLDMRRRLQGNDRPETATSIAALAAARFRQGDSAGAESRFREALAIRRRLYSSPHPELISSLTALAGLLLDRGDYAEAEQLVREAMALEAGLQRRDPAIGNSIRRTLAGILHDTGRYDEAERLSRQVVACLVERLGEQHPSVAHARLSLALVVKDQADYDDAEMLSRQALEFMMRYWDEKPASVADAWFTLAKVLSDKGDLEGAEAASRETLSLHERIWGRDHMLTARPMTLLARTLVERGRYAEAEPLAREALGILREALPADNWKTAKSASVLGAALAGMGKFQEAERLLLDSYPVIRGDRGPQHRRTRQAVERIVALYEAWNRPADAARYRKLLAGSDGDAMARGRS